MARFRRRVSHAFARKVVDKGSQKTKVKVLVSLLGFAGNSYQEATLAVSSDTARANYFDNLVKPFSRIQILHFDLAIYQQGSSLSADGFVDWALFKSPASGFSSGAGTANGSGLASVPFIFRTSRAAVPMLSGTGMPTIYHISGDIKVPPRFQIMAPNDQIKIGFIATPAGAGISYSVSGSVTYMFKV